MRYIIAFLIAANLAYLGWTVYGSRQPSEPAPAEPLPSRPLLNTGLSLVEEYQAGAGQTAAAPPPEQMSADLALLQAIAEGGCVRFGLFASSAQAGEFLADMEAIGLSAVPDPEQEEGQVLLRAEAPQAAQPLPRLNLPLGLAANPVPCPD